MYKQGTVVLTPFPFTDLSGDKVRPAIIVSSNLKGTDVIVVFITSKKKGSSPHTITIAPTSSNGLKTPSMAVCSKIATLDKKVILGELGVLSESDKKAVQKALAAVFGFGS